MEGRELGVWGGDALPGRDLQGPAAAQLRVSWQHSWASQEVCGIFFLWCLCLKSQGFMSFRFSPVISSVHTQPQNLVCSITHDALGLCGEADCSNQQLCCVTTAHPKGHSGYHTRFVFEYFYSFLPSFPFYLFFCLLVFPRQGFSVQPWLFYNLLPRPGWP